MENMDAKNIEGAAPEMLAALKAVAEALAASNFPKKYVNDPTWNPDGHIEATLTISDARKVYAAIEKASGK